MRKIAVGEIRKHVGNNTKLLSLFSIVIFSFFASDSIITYLVPVVLTQHYGSALLMGMVLSSSSITGVIFDVFVSRYFIDRSSFFFIKWALISALLIPFIMVFLPQSTITFLIVMAIWGGYYEMMAFSHFRFIKTYMKPSEHVTGWSLVEVMYSIGTVIGPFLAALLLEKSEALTLSTSVAFLFIASVALFFLKINLPHAARISRTQEKGKEVHIHNQLKIWRILLKKLWPLLIFYFALIYVSTTFWSVGILMVEEIKVNHTLGLFLLPAFSAPAMVFPFIAEKLSHIWGKKRMAFVSAGIGGIALFAGSYTGSVEFLLLSILVSASCIAIAYPEFNAAFEDYMARLGLFGLDVVGIQRVVVSLAFIIGPILSGFLAGMLGNQATVGLSGLLLAVASAFTFMVVPRKVKMPQKELHSLT